MKLGIIFVALLVGLFALGEPAVAAPPGPTYAFTLDQAQPITAGEVVTFTVTRSVPSSDLVWVALRCDDGGGADGVVIWGTFDSVVGHTGGAVLTASGTSCTATLTLSPWHPKQNDPAIMFAVN